MKNEIINEQMTEVSEGQVPSIIQSQFRELKALEKRVNIAIQKAADAQDSANRAKEKPAGLFQKKEAIESLQTATVDLADAQVSAAEAQKITFEYQEKLGEITKYLFGLGVANIAVNRTVVREIEMRLNGASKEELSDLSKQEMLNVVTQLKAQEDIMKKQSDLTKQVKEHEGQIKIQEEKYTRFEKKFAVHEQKDQEQDILIASQIANDEAQDNAILTQKQKDQEHDLLLAEQASNDKKHEHLLERQADKIREYEKTINSLKREIGENEEIIDRQINITEGLSTNLHVQQEKSEKQDAIISKQGDEIMVLKEYLDKLNSAVNTKTNKISTNISTFIAIIALLLAGLLYIK